MEQTIAKCYLGVNSSLRIPFHSGLLSNGVAMTSREIRRTKLAKLAAEYGTASALADKIGTDETYVRNILNGNRGLGPKVARRIEAKLGKPDGWMDRLDSGPPDAQQLVDDYSKAPPEWQLIMRMLARPENHRPEIATAINKIMAGDVPALPVPLYNSRHEQKSTKQDKKKTDRKDR